MSTPFILITTHKVTSGQVEQIRLLAEQYTDFVNERETDVLAQYTFLAEDASELSLVHVFSNAEAADQHLQVAGPLIKQGTELTGGSVRVEAYGTPGPILGQALEANRGAGAQVSVKSDNLTGFARH